MSINRLKDKRQLVLALTLFCVSPHGLADSNAGYVDGSMPFLAIQDSNRQAEAWAMCAAVYNVMSENTEGQPAGYRHLHALRNGAELAVIMSMALDSINSDMTSERYSTLWAKAKLAGSELPKAKLRILAAEAESLSVKGSDKFIDKLTATFNICVSNLEGQQKYIDVWRDMAKNGLLLSPDK